LAILHKCVEAKRKHPGGGVRKEVEMRELIWDRFYHFVKAEYYYEVYKRNSYVIERNLKILIGILSSASIASWAVWNTYPALWSVLLALTTILIIVKPHFPYEKRISALTYALPEFKKLVIEIEYYYNSIIYLNEEQVFYEKEEINNKIEYFNLLYNAIDSKFIDSDLFPHNDKFNNISEENTRARTQKYFKIKEVNEYEQLEQETENAFIK